MVSPTTGMRGEIATKSIFKLPTTTILARVGLPSIKIQLNSVNAAWRRARNIY